MSSRPDFSAREKANLARASWYWNPHYKIARIYRESRDAAIFVRLTQSAHVAELRWIALNTYRCALLLLVFTLIGVGFHTVFSPEGWEFYSKDFSKWRPYVTFTLSDLAIALPVMGTCWAFAAVIVAWCYRSGNARLGVVDLFACEITTLCRVCTVIKLTEIGINAFKDSNETIKVRFSHFDSAENYTPIFDDNASDLQALDVSVVTNITAFYTYWKSMRDSFRHLASTVAGGTSEIHSAAWRNALCSVIYMQFLAFESARKAVDDLIEFEPSHAENTITILLSEMPAFKFLLGQFEPEDVRYKRLELRKPEYPEIVEKVRRKTEENAERYPPRGERADLSDYQRELAAGWDKAKEMLGPLDACFECAFVDRESRPAKAIKATVSMNPEIATACHFVVRVRVIRGFGRGAGVKGAYLRLLTRRRGRGSGGS